LRLQKPPSRISRNQSEKNIFTNATGGGIGVLLFSILRHFLFLYYGGLA